MGELVMYNPQAVPAIMLATGIALAFWGRRIVPFALVLSALVVGFLNGSSILSGLSENSAVLRYGPIVVALLLAVLVYFLYKIAFFAAGLVLGYFVASVLLPQGPLFAVVLSAVVSGALVYLSRNFVFSVLTSVMGAALMATGSVNLAAWMGVSLGVVSYWLILVIITLTGVLYQNKRGRK